MASLFKKIFLLIIASQLIAASAGAADFRVTSKAEKIMVGDSFLIAVYLDTEDESVNALEGELQFDNNLLELKEVRDGNSIVSFWVNRPGQKNSGQITFSGIIPGGFMGEQGLIWEAVFKVLNPGDVVLQLNNVRALKNDGLGTPVNVVVYNWSLPANPAVTGLSPTVVPVAADQSPPEEFMPSITHRADIFDGQWFLVFSTSDKNSGLAYYEVCEGKFRCQVASSPYLLQNQDLNSKIVVQAVDRAGNKRLAELAPTNPPAWYRSYAIFGIIIVVMAGLLLIFKKK